MQLNPSPARYRERPLPQGQGWSLRDYVVVGISTELKKNS
jgi:hypothetical protein